MHLWDTAGGFVDEEWTVRTAFETYRETVAPDAALYIIDLAAYGTLVTPEGYEDVYPR